MCDEVSIREKRDAHRGDDEEFYADASFIVKKSFFRYIKGYPREKYVHSWPEPHTCVYPKANAYYAFLEDTNPFTRFSLECESRKYGNVKPHFKPPEHPYETRDPYREAEAREKYLKRKPICFAVFSKPDLNTTNLASMIADTWNCVLICPVSLVKEEIDKGTEKGRAIRNILKMGECLSSDVIMNLIEARINKRDIFHKGYIVVGLPLIPNETLDYSSYPSYPKQQSDVQNLSDNFMKIFDSPFHRICGTKAVLEESQVLSSDAQELQISSDQKFKNQACAITPNYENFIASQVENIFTTWPIKPSIIIQVMCPDADVVRKREHFRIDSATGRIVDSGFNGISENIEMLFSQNRTDNETNVAFESYGELLTEEQILDRYLRKYLLKRPSDRKSNVEAQCELYKRFAMPVIDTWLRLHKTENVIRVDGRPSVSRMLQIVIARLRTLPAPRVILPKRFIDLAAVNVGGESPTAPSVDEFAGESNEEAFLNLTNRETVSPLYPWRLSSWNFLCPVELTKGRTTEGASKYAVGFMNKLFFLSSLEAADTFIENPRTFLVPFSPRPTCKMVVLGPKYSGKSDLCRKLAQAFGGAIINVNEAVKSLADVDSDMFFDSPNRKSLEDRADIIVEKVQDVPTEEIDIEVWRDGGYIVDGMCPDIDTWKTVVEDSKIIFEDVILLFDEEPYEYLLSKWHSIHDAEEDSQANLEGGMEYSGGMNTYEDNGGEEEESRGLIEYLGHIQQFQLDWEEIKEKVEDACKNLVTCNVSKVDDVPKYVIESIKDRYTDKAKVMSDDEKEREKDIAEYIAMADDTEDFEEEEEGDEGQTVELDDKEDNRRLGDTNHYCPVATLKYDVLWKGKEDFSVIFMDKIYLLSSDAALEEFIRGPQKMSLPLRKPLSLIPPLRISVIGPLGCGKSALADGISREYGLAHIDYFQGFTTFMKHRGMLPVSRRDVLTSSEDLLEEVELPEDLRDEKYTSDEATVQTFVRRYWGTGGDLPERMLRECLLEFFDGLYNFHGVVLDHFPSCPEDVEIAREYYTVPEVIIELRCGRDTSYERIMPELLQSWKNNLEEKKHAEEMRYTHELDEYERNREAWIDKMLCEAFDPRNMLEGEETSFHSISDHEHDTLADDYSFLDYVDSEILELKRFELVETWHRENPEPVLFTGWEEFETARERIEQQFGETFESESQKLDATRNALENESIPYIYVDAEKSSRDVLFQVMRLLDPFTSRDISILEKVYTMDLETAELLLDYGYYLLSSFGRWCPVQLYENRTPLQMFLPLEAQQEIYPVVHRQFIYFVGGKDAHSAFSKNPLKYLEQDCRAPIIPFRFSIIGPPKCGKTTLARRFAAKYGLKVVTRGAALRHILRYFPWTESAQSAEPRLRQGHVVPEKSLYRAIEMYSIDPRSTSQGFVLDGFPSNRREYEDLTFLGIQPMVILDLKASLTFCTECLLNEADETKKPANFSEKFLAHRYSNWSVDQQAFRDWLKRFTQNVIELDATRSTWHVWSRADEEACLRYTNIRQYFRECDYDKVHSLKFMSVSPYEFRRRQSLFEVYCPLCLFYENTMNTSGPPPDHRGMVQFRRHFYWICTRHMNDFIKNPEKHLPPTNTARLPEDRPRVLTEVVDKEHSCWAKRLQAGGFCLVTYVEGLPLRNLIPGKSSIGVLYKDNVYLFCTEDCRDKFLAQCDKYASVDVNFLRTMPPIDVKNLPDLGFLEQTVAKVIVEAIDQISIIRPKLPGLSPSTTAAIFIGVYLKTRNVSCAMNETEIYDAVSRRIFGRDKILKVAMRVIKKKLNPFVTMPAYKDSRYSQYSVSAELSLMSHLFARPSHFITFRRTSPTQIMVDPESDSDD